LTGIIDAPNRFDAHPRILWGKGYAFEAMQAVIAHAMAASGIERLSAPTHAGLGQVYSLPVS
jgi:hypothetical protein